jgi:hypothetical protein
MSFNDPRFWSLGKADRDYYFLIFSTVLIKPVNIFANCSNVNAPPSTYSIDGSAFNPVLESI